MLNTKYSICTEIMQNCKLVSNPIPGLLLADNALHKWPRMQPARKQAAHEDQVACKLVVVPVRFATLARYPIGTGSTEGRQVS